MDPIYFAGVSCVLIALTSLGVHTISVRKIKRQASVDEQRIRELELSLHTNQRNFLAEKNALESEHYAALSAEREKLSLARIEHNSVLQQERDRAALAAREQARRDFELQASLFSISVRPYVRIVKDEGYFNATFDIETGYQYQLMVNGVPAFQPHHIPESKETAKKFNEDNLNMLIQRATDAAERAVALIGGKAPANINIAQALVERISGKA
ncbi:hypothetical protein [Pseudoduganella sp. GCM10020061]|uniref:hypothetical protein n=1 Tax=Pseudoduganella sp. GCM10020061 TaxID=3317345 RepID=UPI00362F53CE